MNTQIKKELIVFCMATCMVVTSIEWNNNVAVSVFLPIIIILLHSAADQRNDFLKERFFKVNFIQYEIFNCFCFCFCFFRP